VSLWRVCGKVSSRRGFTLLEIVVVLVIIGMVMTLIIPRLPNSERENLKISARTLASTLRYLQDRGATTGTTYYLHMEPGTDNVKVNSRLLKNVMRKAGCQAPGTEQPRHNKLVSRGCEYRATPQTALRNSFSTARRGIHPP
jgi:prepilin-type N-terminal cleavage/methylation domain-containing protein